LEEPAASSFRSEEVTLKTEAVHSFRTMGTVYHTIGAHYRRL
jgi:hypothetical protein